MPIFHLTPIAAALDDPDWASSPYRGQIWANAATEAEARGLASGRYEDARANIPGVSEQPSPWLQGRLVSAEIVPGVPGGTTLAEGVVMGEQQI